MELIQLFSDLFVTASMLYFLKAEIVQLKKIIRKKTVKSISYNTYISKVKAIIFGLTGFTLAGLWLSFGMIFAELIVIFYIIKLMKKYRGQ